MGHLEEFNKRQDEIDAQFYLDGPEAKKILDLLMGAHGEGIRVLECMGGPFDGKSFAYIESFILELIWTHPRIETLETHHYELAYRGNKQFFWRWIGLAHHGGAPEQKQSQERGQ